MNKELEEIVNSYLNGQNAQCRKQAQEYMNKHGLTLVDILLDLMEEGYIRGITHTLTLNVTDLGE